TVRVYARIGGLEIDENGVVLLVGGRRIQVVVGAIAAALLRVGRHGRHVGRRERGREEPHVVIEAAAGAARRGRGRILVVIVVIELERLADVLGVGKTPRIATLGARGVEACQDDRGKQRDDGDYHQKLDKREPFGRGPLGGKPD